MKQIKILLVDDDSDLLTAFEAILSNRGYQVIIALNKNDGLEKMDTEKPDLAILDVMMDDEHDGFDMARNIKSNHPDFPIIMLTGISEVTGVNFRAASANPDWLPADDYLDKPVTPDELIEHIEAIMAKTA